MVSVFKIRLAGPQDAEQLVQIHYRAVHQISNEYYSQAALEAWSPLPNQARYDWMNGVIASDSKVVLVAEVQGQKVGFSICGPQDGFIDALYVDPQCAGQGIGQALLEYTEQYLSQAGATEANLKASDNSVLFYETRGYHVVKPSSQVLADGSEMTCVEMSKRLPEI